MKQNVSLWQLVGFALTSFFGTLFHFLYDLTGGSVLVAPFSGVNESTWEHMKLLFFPLFIFALVESRFFGEYENFWCVKILGSSAGLLLIPVLFYTYNGVIGESPDWINIAIFFISAAAVFLLETYLFKKGSLRCKHPLIAFGIFCVIGVLFIVFTFITPEIEIFKDPLTGTYGI